MIERQKEKLNGGKKSKAEWRKRWENTKKIKK